LTKPLENAPTVSFIKIFIPIRFITFVLYFYSKNNNEIVEIRLKNGELFFEAPAR
jgi:hypothetical protein